MILFGSGTLSAKDSNGNNIAFGILQNVEVNISYSKQSLRGDKKLFPVAEYFTEGDFSGSAEYAEILPEQFELILGSTTSGPATQKVITIDEDATPNFFEITLVNQTENDKITMKLFRVSSPSLTYSFAEGEFVIPSFEFSATPSEDNLTSGGKKKIAEITLEQPDADDTAPTITLTNPANGETGVPVAQNIEITYSKSIVIAEAVNTDNYILLDENNVQVHPSSITYDADNKKVTFNPTSDLDPTEKYTFIIGTGIVDLSGNKLEDAVQIEFTTAASS